MQTLIWILLTNLFTGTILYLILSLKLEKSADDFRIKKLRREIDETIREFNSTAERNISLLENRIRTARDLLKGDQFKPIDMNDEDISLIKSVVTDRNGRTAVSVSGDSKKKQSFDFLVDEPVDLSADQGILEKDDIPDDDELKERFSSSSSKHDLIAALYREGRSIDDLSRISGISSRELSLILQLNGLNIEGH